MIHLLAGEGGALITPLQFDWLNFKTAMWALGIFLVVLFLMKKFAWGPIVAGLQGREDRIAGSLDKAAEIEKAAEELSQTNKQLLAEAQKQAQQIIADARESAKIVAVEAAAKAQTEIDAQRERFQNEMRLETDKARARIRADAVDLTIEATAKLLGRSLTGPDQNRLVEEALAEAEKVARSRN